MGVRARIAEWPPKRDAPKDAPNNHPPPRDRTSPAGAHQAPAGVGATTSFKALHRFARRRSKEVEFQDGWGGRGGGRCPPVPPLRQRSSSEVTLSECDPEEVPTQP
ncbi:SI1L3 protein, partial [Tricholaema leucomelas]|nr:SI1L3 protein [Tricholaema leucomelas]